MCVVCVRGKCILGQCKTASDTNTHAIHTEHKEREREKDRSMYNMFSVCCVVLCLYVHVTCDVAVCWLAHTDITARPGSARPQPKL